MFQEIGERLRTTLMVIGTFVLDHGPPGMDWTPVLDWAVVALPTLLAVVAVIMSTLRLETEASKNWWRVGMVVFGAFISVITWEQQEQTRRPPIQPDVTLAFVYPAEPALLLFNNSDKVANQIKWTVLLWNLDDPRTYSAGKHLSDAHEPLQIPVSTFDFIRPKSIGGPENLFSSQLVSPYVKDGNKLFGSASVSCPDCGRGRSYFVYIEFGHGGWFWEIPNEKSGLTFFPAHLTIPEVHAFFENVVSQIPTSQRTAIKDWP